MVWFETPNLDRTNMAGPAHSEAEFVYSCTRAIASMVAASSPEQLRAQMCCMEEAVAQVSMDVSTYTCHLENLGQDHPMRADVVSFGRVLLHAAETATRMMLDTMGLIKDKCGRHSEQAAIVLAKVHELLGRIEAGNRRLAPDEDT